MLMEYSQVHIHFHQLNCLCFLHLPITPNDRFESFVRSFDTHKGDKNTLHLDTQPRARTYSSILKKKNYDWMRMCIYTFSTSLIFIWFSRRRRRKKKKTAFHGTWCNASDTCDTRFDILFDLLYSVRSLTLSLSFFYSRIPNAIYLVWDGKDNIVYANLNTIQIRVLYTDCHTNGKKMCAAFVSGVARNFQ